MRSNEGAALLTVRADGIVMHLSLRKFCACSAVETDAGFSSF